MVRYSTNCLLSFLGVTIACLNYGEQIGNRLLAKAVIFFLPERLEGIYYAHLQDRPEMVGEVHGSVPRH